MLRKRLDTDKELRRFFDGETTTIPQFYVERIKEELGPLYAELPAGAIEHDPNAWLKTQTPDTVVLKAAPGRRANRPARRKPYHPGFSQRKLTALGQNAVSWP